MARAMTSDKRHVEGVVRCGDVFVPCAISGSKNLGRKPLSLDVVMSVLGKTWTVFLEWRVTCQTQC